MILQSKDSKKHQRFINKKVKEVNKSFEKDTLWRGRFVIRQVECPYFYKYNDNSGGELIVRLLFIDKKTGQTYYKNISVVKLISINSLYCYMNNFITINCKEKVWNLSRDDPNYPYNDKTDYTKKKIIKIIRYEDNCFPYPYRYEVKF